MTLGNFRKAVDCKSVSLTSTVLPIASTLILFATSDITAADEAFITANSSNASMVSWATTAPSSSIGHRVEWGCPLSVLGNYNVQRIHVTSATTLASSVSITLSKY